MLYPCLWVQCKFVLKCYKCSQIIHVLKDVLALLQRGIRLGSARLSTARLSLARFAFLLQFSTALEWAGLSTCRYSCAASTAVTPEKHFISTLLLHALAGSTPQL